MPLVRPISFEHHLKLGENFFLSEFLVSERYPELLTGVVLNEAEIQKFYFLVQFVLEPVREEFGPVHITSAYRPPILNRLVGGSETSQHLYCEAADFVAPSAQSGSHVYKFITDFLRWPGEIIWYNPQKRFHVALPMIGVKSDQFVKQVLKA